MLITTNLRADAEAEAVRLQAVRTKAAESSARFLPRGIVCATLWRPRPGRLLRTGAIFFVRTRIVDGRGRLVEDLMVPLEFRSAGLRAQALLDACHAAVRSAALAEVARRIRALAKEYGRGLQRARDRERRLMAVVENRVSERVQAGLFDHRAEQDHDRSERLRTTVSNEHRDRQEALDASMSLLIAQHSETVLLLIIARKAHPACYRD
jgi:hypothetical protein